MNWTAIVYLVSLAAFLGPLTQTIYTPILSEATGDFAASSLLVNLIHKRKKLLRCRSSLFPISMLRKSLYHTNAEKRKSEQQTP
jgi:hypothetical protein